MASETINIDELEQSRSQAATTASQTVKISKQVVSNHDSDTTAHQDIRDILSAASADKAGLVYIDETVTKVDIFNAVPNVAGVVNYIKENIGDAIYYAGQIDIDSKVQGEQFIIYGEIRKGAMYRFIGNAAIEYNGHIYSAEDYVIANTAMSSSSFYRDFSSFDWYNVQDKDVVKPDKVQTLTNKTLTDTTNIFRKAQSREIDGTVYIAKTFDEAKADEKSEKYDLLTASALQDELNKRLLVSRSTISGKTVVTPCDNDSSSADLSVEKIYNLKDIIVTTGTTPDNKDLTTDFKLPFQTEYPNIGTTEYLATMSYVDSKDISEFLKENKPVVKPIFVNGQFTAYRQDGSIAETSTVAESTSAISKSFLKGYKVTFTAYYKWKHDDAKFDPTRWSVTNFTTDPASPNYNVLPISGSTSTVKLILGTTSSFITSAKTGYLYFYAPKTGLVVDNGNVKKASGENADSNYTSISFFQQYYGLWSKSTSLTAADIQSATALTKAVQTKPNMTISNIAYPGGDDYFYYIVYPSDWSDITAIKGTKDGTTADYKNSFEKLANTVAVTNAAGLVVNYKVYRSKDLSSYAGFTFAIS